jgi:hypothetical protein
MANNINCTCGHSWSKASSSKKDMYVCHMCGKDNTMKDGGWLNKFEQGGMNLEQKGDNYGKKPNPNDVQASVGPDFVGLGYDITGRNYSPAWGGQFQDGGRLPIITSNPKDPRLKAYQDSLALYKRSNQTRVDNLLKQGFKYDTDKNVKKNYKLSNKEKSNYQKSIGVNKNKGLQKIVQSGNDGKIDQSVGGYADKKAQYELTHGQIAPIELADLYDSWWRSSPTLSLENNRPNPNYKKPFAKDLEGEVLRNFFHVPIYKEPIQPVIYEESTTPTEPVKQSSKKEPVIVNDPKDPRLKAYQDSLQVYNSSKFVKEHPLTGNYVPGKEDVKQMNINIDKKNINKYKPKLETTNTGYYYDYKKPVQPVEYKKLEEIKPTQFTPKGSKKYIVNGMEVSEEDFLGSGAPTGGSKRIIYNTPNKGTQKVLRLDGTPETDPDKIRRALATANKKEEFQSGGFLEPISYKLPSRYRIPYAEPSSELAMSIGGEGGEPAYLIPSFKGGKELKDPIAEYKKTGEHLGGPFKTWQEADKWEQEIRHPYVEKGKPIPTPLKRWGDMAMGGSLPGAVGFTYARTAGSAPSNGKYAKKTKASAQNGKEMKFYQEGLDFKPNSIAQDGGAIVDPMGQWAHPGEVTIIPSTDITMEGVDYPVLGISDTGDQQMMYPGEDYDFDGEYVTEYPMMKKGGWLNKYK